MLKWAGNNPVFLCIAIALSAGFIGAYPLAAIFVLTTLAVGIALFQWMVWLGKRSREQIGRRWGLVRRADYEHWLVMNGDPRGWYGGYPPVNAEQSPHYPLR